MNRYQNQTPRTAFAIAAVVMSVATMGAFVGAPSAVENDTTSVTARATHATPVTIAPWRIEVVARAAEPVNVAEATSLRALR